MRSLCFFVVLFLVLGSFVSKDFRNWSRSYLGRGLKSHGSGFFVNSEHLITNYHVIEKCTKYMARTLNGDPIKLSLVAYDMYADLAILKSNDSHKMTFGYLYDKKIMKAEPLHIIGYPANSYFYTRAEVENSDFLASAYCGNKKECSDKVKPLQSSLLFKSSNSGNNSGINRVGSSGTPILNDQGDVMGVMNRVNIAIKNQSIAEFMQKSNVRYYTSSEKNYLEGSGQSVEDYGNRFVVQLHCKLGR